MVAVNPGFLSLFRALCLVFVFSGFVKACEGLSSSLEIFGGVGICTPELLGYATNGVNGSDHNFANMINTETMVEDGIEIESDLIPVYDVRPAPGKGLGAFAKHHLKRGTPILIEEPLFSVPVPEMVPGQGFRILDMINSIEAEFKHLSSEQKQEFLNLHEYHFPSEEHPNKLMTIFRSNAYNTGDDHVGMFPKIARINHSCRPNSGNWWSEKTDRRVVYASRDIEKDEEITVSYIPLLMTTKDRQARLRQYGFTCDCSACQSADSDKRRIRISNSLDDLEQKQHSPSKKSAINEKRIVKALALIEMLEAEKLGDYLARAYHLAAVFNKHGRHIQDAVEWATKEWDTLQVAESDSEETLEAMNFMFSLKAGK